MSKAHHGLVHCRVVEIGNGCRGGAKLPHVPDDNERYGAKTKSIRDLDCLLADRLARDLRVSHEATLSLENPYFSMEKAFGG